MGIECHFLPLMSGGVRAPVMHRSSPGLWEIQSKESRVELGVGADPMSDKRKTKEKTEMS